MSKPPLIKFYPGQLLPVEPESIKMATTGDPQWHFTIKYHKSIQQALLEEKLKPEPKINKVEKVVEPTGRKFRTEE